jgi:protein-disulfide isomerase
MPKQQRVGAGTSKWKLTPIQLLIGAVAAAIVIVAVLITLSQFSAKSPTEAQTTPSATKTAAEDECPNLISGYAQTMGSPEAPVQVTEYADYQCPYCGHYATEYQPRLIHDFICTGKVRFTFKNYAFLGDESRFAAQAAICAADQGQFWVYHNKLFANQRGENTGAFKTDKLKGFAKDLKLDVDKFSQCLDSGKYATQVRDEFQEGQKQGVDSTPTSFVDDQKVLGPATYDELAQAIETALSKKQ